jgi:hypothetical protein
MTKKYFIYALLSILFSSLIACGGSNSSASGDTQKDNSGTLKACAIGTQIISRRVSHAKLIQASMLTPIPVNQEKLSTAKVKPQKEVAG